MHCFLPAECVFATFGVDTDSADFGEPGEKNNQLH